jgi:hypothetical protein
LAFLVVAGITVPIALTGATKKAPEKAGAESRAFGGNLRSTTRWTKRNWQFTTKGLLDADAAAIEAAVNPGDFVTCTGDALGGASVSCLVTCGDGPYVKVAGGFRRTLVLTLREA